MENKTEMGTNKTAASLHAKMTDDMVEKSKEVAITEERPTPHKMIEMKKSYLKEDFKLGSVPIPTSLKGAGKTLLEKAKGKSPEVLLDKLGERMAFERAGVRLYEAIIAKCEAANIPEETLSKLREYRDEEHSHFMLVHATIESLGADPTAMTPSADATAVAGMGLFQLAGDPRANVTQSLQALLTAELVDHDGWEMLIKLARDSGLDEAAVQFEQALKEESEHLSFVRSWYQEMVSSEAQSLQS